MRRQLLVFLFVCVILPFRKLPKTIWNGRKIASHCLGTLSNRVETPDRLLPRIDGHEPMARFFHVSNSFSKKKKKLSFL
jgi:hypothetical protein